MAYELVYTSASKGLTRGSSGFCVVACTKGLGSRLVVTLEGLSAYKPLYPHYAPNAWDNPISRTHYIYEANGEQQHILSRICFNGVDHTQRSNKLASHLVLSDRETMVAQGGPASLLLHEELFKDASWTIKAEYFPKQKEIPATSVQVQKCSLWESIMGDAGWAGYLAQTYIDFPAKNVYVAYSPEQNKDILPLIHEAMTLLPNELRWKVTFNTYFVNLPAGMSCSWRCCPVDSDAMRAAKRSPMNIVIDITKPQTLEKDSELINIARTGIVEKPEEIPEPEESKTSGNDTKTRKIVPSPKLELNQPKPNLRLPQTGNNVPVGYQPFDDDPVEEIPSFWERKKSTITIVAIICLLVAVIGGVVYFVSVTKEKQTYLVQSGEYKRLRDAYDGAKSRGDKVRETRSTVRTEKEVNGLIEEVKDLERITDSIRKAAEKLLIYQKLFEKRQEQELTSGSVMDDTPRGLVEICDTLKKDLTNELSLLNTCLAEDGKLPAKGAETKKSIREGKTAQTQPPVVQGKTLPSKIPPKEPEKKVEKTAKKLPTEDARYLWIKSDSFHKMTPNGNIDIQVGTIEPNKISIFLLPNMKEQNVGTELQCEPDQFDHQAVIETKFDKNKGVLSFILKGTYTPPNDAEILIKLDRETTFPLYFRIDISKIKPASKNKDNLKIEIQDKVKVSVKSSAIQLPKLFYTIENSPCRSSPTLWLNCPAYKKLEIKKQGDQYIHESVDDDIKQLISRENKLATIEKDIKENPMDFAGKQKAKFEKELTAYREASTVVNDDELRLKIEKLYNKDAKEPPTPKDLREKVRKENKIDKNEEKMCEWVKKYDAMQKIAEQLVMELKNIPLKEFGYSSYQGTFLEEKKKADKELQDIETAIRESSVVLVYGDQEYEQFPIKDLLQ